MAGDWIKMRGALYDHPKVIAIARELQANRAFRDWLTPGGGGPMNGQVVSNAALRGVTVGLLLKIWSAAREHGKFDEDDLVLAHSEVSDLDEMAGAPGVGEAMASVGWAIEKGGVTLPNFKQFNVPMTPAERQKNYRENHRKQGDEPVTRPLRGGRNKSVTREEKRREDLKATPPQGSTTPAELVLEGQAPEKQKTPVATTWDSYAAAYKERYGVEPVRNARVNGQLASVVSRVGADVAPTLAAFFVRSGDQTSFYAKVKHGVGYLVKDCERLVTEMKLAGGARPVGKAPTTILVSAETAAGKVMNLKDYPIGDPLAVAKKAAAEYSKLLWTKHAKNVIVGDGSTRRVFSILELTGNPPNV